MLTIDKQICPSEMQQAFDCSLKKRDKYFFQTKIVYFLGLGDTKRVKCAQGA